MKRRAFIKTLGLAVVATQVPLPKAAPDIPAWFRARYEVRFATHPLNPQNVIPILYLRNA